MYRTLMLIFVLLFTISNIFAGDAKSFGKELSKNEVTKVSQILDTPETFDGKVVKIEGTIVNVCEKRGCWIEVASDKEYQTIKVKVEDGEIVFPMEAKGKPAVIEGKVYSFVPAVNDDCDSGSSCSDDKKEKAEKTAEKKADACCPSKKPEVKKVYQIKGHGAVITL